MTALTADAPARVPVTVSPYRLSFPRVLRSEWIKLATLRSTWWSIGIVAALTIGIALLMAAASTGFSGGFEPISAALMPMQFTMLLAGTLGAIAITGEYSTGMIRSTLTADPHRGSVLAAKAVVVGLLLGATSLVIFAVAAVATSPIMTDPVDWSDASRSVVPVLYGALSMAVFALLGLSWGFILRNGPGAISATVGLLFVLPIVVSIFPYQDPAWQWIRDLGNYLPMNASQALVIPGGEFGLSDPAALLTLALWVAAGMIGAWAVLRTRDA